VNTEGIIRVRHIAVLLTALLLLNTSCSFDAPAVEEIIADEVTMVELFENETANGDDLPDDTPSLARYYWPWLSHGQLLLSSGEIVVGPDLFESDLGFIAEITEDHGFEGRLVWMLDESDPLLLEWIMLNFFVEYYEDNNRLADMEFQFTIDQFQLNPEDPQLQEFTLDLTDEQYGLEVRLSRVLFGRAHESAVTGALLNFVALDLEMRVADNR
jgi:hypothetical protein